MTYKDPQKKREYNRAWFGANRDKQSQYNRTYRAKNVEKERERTQKRRLARYGLSPEAYNALIASGLCHICGDPFVGSHHIDHCHDTGKVRGALCSNCNTGIGIFRDNPEVLRSAASYLERYQL